MLKLVRDTKLRGEMGGEGRKIIEEKFTWDAVADRFEQALIDSTS
jgi:glycosyltransferase involved in cell wall biosynthesis